jgi:hypothetical protein
MDTLLSILFFLLSLVGVDVGGTTYVTRTTSDGATTLESRAEVKSGVARFECVRSATGQCHYTVLPPECAGPSRLAPWPAHRCPRDAMKRFAVDAGASHSVAGLARFRLCVQGDADAPCKDGTDAAGEAAGEVRETAAL